MNDGKEKDNGDEVVQVRREQEGQCSQFPEQFLRLARLEPLLCKVEAAVAREHFYNRCGGKQEEHHARHFRRIAEEYVFGNKGLDGPCRVLHGFLL